MTELSEQSIKTLRFRQNLGRWILKVLRREMVDEYDAQKVQEVEAIYHEQLQQVNDELQRRRRARREELGEELPESPVAKMKPAVLGTRAKSGGNGSVAERLRQELEKRGVQVEMKEDTQEVRDG